MPNGLYVFMNKDNKVFCTMDRFPGPLNDLLAAAFASDVKGMIITDYPNAQRGDIWNGSGFTKMFPEVEPEYEERVALLVDNEIVDILDLSKNYPYYQIWIDGFSNEHFGFDATGYENVRSGSTWDGTSFTLPDKPAY
jgi:hypothetical protein